MGGQTGETDRRAELTELCGYLAGLPTLDSLLFDGMERVAAFFGAERAVVFIPDRENQLRAVAWVGESLRELRLPSEPANLVGWSAAAAAPASIRNVWDLAELVRLHARLRPDERLDQLLGLRLRGAIVAPLRGDGQLLGVLLLANRADEIGIFSSRDLVNATEVSEVVAKVLAANLGHSSATGAAPAPAKATPAPPAAKATPTPPAAKATPTPPAAKATPTPPAAKATPTPPARVTPAPASTKSAVGSGKTSVTPPPMTLPAPSASAAGKPASPKHAGRENGKERPAPKPAGKWDYLVETGVIQPELLAKSIAAAEAASTDVSRYLIEKVGIARAEVEKALSQYYGVPFYRFTASQTIPEDLRQRLRVEFLRKICAVPIERKGPRLIVVIDNPLDIGRADSLRSVETDREVALHVGFRDEILACIEASYGLRPDVNSLIKELSTDESTGAIDEVIDDADEGDESDSAIIKLANQIIIDAFQRGASDIHIEPYGKEENTRIRFRIDGDCVNYQEIPAVFRSPLVARFKIMARLDISEKRKPQDGKIKFRMRDRTIELRVATLPTVNQNEDVVMRILAASKPIPLDEMGMSERNLREMRGIISKPYGLILCVGPTGSGKTTTLHSALGSINTADMKIWTAEDPVEITQAGLRQVQVQPKIGFDFAAAMRSFLRADPDVIMVGEMRDKETASTGVEASLTGHLVFSTLHTNSAPETITRLVDMGLDPFSFADALLGVLAQRLARGICKKCREQYPAGADEVAEIVEAFGEEGAAKRGVLAPDFKLWRAPGCEQCGKTGLKGRLAVHELLIADEAIKRAIVSKAPVEDVRRLAIAGGMTTLLQDGVEKAIAGKTDIKQVLAVCLR
jgi:type II secretory ATPase GspE/PulE/Tfp pilus assembly ATPase PilB-like protein/outer membrane biosynthesis protein TonB